MDLESQYLNDLYNLRQSKTYSDVSQLFELNYQKLTKLIPLIKQTAHNSIIQHSKYPDLHLIVEERFTYTGIFTLTHILSGDVQKPDIKFKVYFDAQLVEVLSVCNETVLNNDHPYLAQCGDMDIQWELNLFIERWLDYCLDKYQGVSWQTL
jgi:uncharacterized protein YqiB (DUF1249 family)